MGFAVGAVVGGKIGCPDDTCIGFTGDGAFMMQGSEISTAKQNNIGAIWLVLSDNNLSMVSQGMEEFKPDKNDPTIWHKLYELGAPDLEQYSRGLGADAYTVNKPSDLADIMPTVLKRANKDNVPQVIIANILKTEVPPYYNPMY
jgi:acetolactate synthase-1/2/3 large subunit